LKEDRPERESATQRQNSLGRQTDTDRQTEQEKTNPRCTISEVREKSAQGMLRLLGLQFGPQVQKGEANRYFECGFLSLNDSAFHSNHSGVSAVIGSQFRKDVSDLTLHGIFAHRHLHCNLLIRVTFGDQAQYADFRRG
jgi:hypothetical protein